MAWKGEMKYNMESLRGVMLIEEERKKRVHQNLVEVKPNE